MNAATSRDVEEFCQRCEAPIPREDGRASRLFTSFTLCRSCLALCIQPVDAETAGAPPKLEPWPDLRKPYYTGRVPKSVKEARRVLAELGRTYRRLPEPHIKAIFELYRAAGLT